MRQRVVDLEAAISAVKPYLEQYLQEHGINTTKNFVCINPKHGDTDASMTCKKVHDNAYCFGCHCTCDIFQAAAWIENKPIKGPEFIEENVLYLAKKYDIPVKLKDLTPEEIYEYRTYAAYRYASELISNKSFGDYTLADEEISRRGWDKDKLSQWGVGTVNYDEFKQTMNNAGYDTKFLTSVDLDRQSLFSNNNLLFTVYDDYGRPVGFSARNLKHKKENKDSGPKYLNTKGTDLECAIFKKGERLYGFDIAKEASAPLYIFEGQPDVITARHNGLMNCCCTLGTVLTDYHINLLKKHGVFNIVLVFDGDEAGQRAIQKALDDKFSAHKEFRVRLCQLPAGEDPDELLRKRGMDEFVRLKKWTAFEWRLSKFMAEHTDDIQDDKRQEIAEKMARIIVSEPSHIRQEEMAKQVSKVTGYELSTIISEVKRLRNERDAEIAARKRAAVESFLFDVQRNPDDIEHALIEAQHAVADINKSAHGVDDQSGTLNFILSQKETDEAKSGEFSGFFMKPEGLGGIAARLDDDWRSGTLVFVGGSEQAGKSTFAAQMLYEIADDERNDAICIYHSIDDAAKFILYKFVCNASQNIDMKLNYIANPNYWNKQGIEWIRDAREKAYKKIISMVQEGRLVLKDASNGQSFSYISEVLRATREKHPSKKIVLVCDNLHKYPDYSEIQGQERVKRLSNAFKNATTMYDATIISTVEYRKQNPGELPTNVALAETRALQYDASVIIHLYNDLHHTSEEEAVLVHKDQYGNILPRIWVKFGKNKVSGYEGREFLDLFGAAGQYRSVDLETAINEQRERLQFLKENKQTSY